MDKLDKWWDKYCGSVMFTPEALTALKQLFSEAEIKAVMRFLLAQDNVSRDEMLADVQRINYGGE